MTLKAKKYVITGSTTDIGKALVQAAGHSVIELSRAKGISLDDEDKLHSAFNNADGAYLMMTFDMEATDLYSRKKYINKTIYCMTNTVINLVNELEATKAMLIKAISSIEEHKFNAIPFKDSWTAAQVSEHLLKAIGTGVLYGDTKPTDREPGEKIQETAVLFLNMDIKMTSPDFILPSEDAHTEAKIITDIETTFETLLQAVRTLDLSATCVSFEIPGFGEFTRLEFVYFFMFHTQRHINQLKTISKFFAN